MLKKAINYCIYRLTAAHRNGFGVHSPFVFRLVSEVLSKHDDEALQKIRRWKKELSMTEKNLETINAGAGSKVHAVNTRKIRSIIRKSSIAHKYGRVLYHLSREYRPSTIIELGTGLGISTAYLASGNPCARVISIDADVSKIRFAGKALQLLSGIKPELINGSFSDVLLSKLESAEDPLLIFIDGDHRFDALTGLFDLILNYKKADTVIVIDDIRWSDEMGKAWNMIRENRESIITIDLFTMGIVFFREGMLKQNFKINF